MTHSNDEPHWLKSARTAWPNGTAPRGLDPTWSPYWIKKFLGYLERRKAARECPPLWRHRLVLPVYREALESGNVEG